MDEKVQNAVDTAVTNIIVPRVEMAASSIQKIFLRGPVSLSNNSEVADLAGNYPETSYLSASSRDDLDQTNIETDGSNDSGMLNKTFSTVKITFRVKMLITGILYAYPTDERNFSLKPIIGFNKH